MIEACLIGEQVATKPARVALMVAAIDRSTVDCSLVRSARLDI